MTVNQSLERSSGISFRNPRRDCLDKYFTHSHALVPSPKLYAGSVREVCVGMPSFASVGVAFHRWDFVHDLYFHLIWLPTIFVT
ncbi:hypothetical protein BC938DRAFT_480556 [Jimgerdemannia flammicorona]|uniref:Uncharacterized protein n=1 Tax=Jimgerdemannia flammicorona TaxID=994334 RepID=A0A433QI98_9FUNG|nr:hypothetical protein BC938DRAFT_480556 [Jimgerdemannia flammicorona]